jgi:hypothetical protein
MFKVYRYPLVEIKWDDAAASNSWERPDVMELSIQIVTSVGFLVKETTKHIVLSSTYDETHVNASIQIPKGMIISRKLLARAKKG